MSCLVLCVEFHLDKSIWGVNEAGLGMTSGWFCSFPDLRWWWRSSAKIRFSIVVIFENNLSSLWCLASSLHWKASFPECLISSTFEKMWVNEFSTRCLCSGLVSGASAADCNRQDLITEFIWRTIHSWFCAFRGLFSLGGVSSSKIQSKQCSQIGSRLKLTVF